MAVGRVLVTGGSGGLGRSIVELLRREGADVAFTFLHDAAGAADLARVSGARAYPLDLRDPRGPERLVDEIESGVGELDGLVNNAGVSVDGLLALTSDEDWQRVVDTNLGGAFRCSRAVLPRMISRRRGAIVNVVSLAALHGIAGQTSYAASKAGTLGLTRSLAREVGRRRIRVNAVAPGFMATALTSSLAEASVHELRRNECLPDGVDMRCVAETVAFLLSSRASSITGQCIVVDSGASA